MVDWRSSVEVSSGGSAGSWWRSLKNRFRASRKRPERQPGRRRRAGRRPGDNRWMDHVPDLDEDAKALLKKVEDEGIHALTDEERVRLMEAFRRRRERDEYLH